MGSCNDSTQPFAKTICSICYEDLKPIVEDLQAISLCGHVFHELCIQQWFEYCSKGKKKCPICKQNCSASDLSRLYFQSVGDSDDTNLSQKLQTRKEDPEELKLEVRRLEGKVKGLNLALESRESDFFNIIDELSLCKEQLKTETLLKIEAMEQTRTIDRLLMLKNQELKNLVMERNKLQEMNTDLQKRKINLAKEVAELKLASDFTLTEEQTLKLASFSNKPISKETVETLNKSLAVRNQSYTELMTKYSTLAKDEARSRKELEELKEKIKRMETAKEMKDNEVLRAPKALKKTKDSLNDTCALQDTIKESDVHLRKTKRLRATENNEKSNNKVGVTSYILIDDDPKVSISPESPSSGSVPQPTKSSITDDDVAYVNEIGRCRLFSSITNEASLLIRGSQEGPEICFSAGVLAPDGTKRHIGSWCKRGQNNKGLNASSVSKQSSGDLIAVGADGRGGTTKVLKSLNRPLNDSRGSLFSAKYSKFGTKTNGFGSLQIDHFFSKADQ